MSLLIEYLDWRGDLSFDNVAENEIDAVLMTQVVMLPLHGLFEKSISIEKLAKVYFEKQLDKVDLGIMSPSLLNEMLLKMQDSKRYSDCIVSNYLFITDEEKQMELTAITVDTPKTRYVVFAGTGDTLVSWRENFNLIYKTPTPSQLESIKYLQSVTARTRKKVIVCGHSKGGHLALYSSLNCDSKTQAKIVKVYNIDGPGLSQEECQKHILGKAYLKVTALFPECSIIGRLFDHCEKTEIVQCDSIGLYQHDCFNWFVSANGFVKSDKFDIESDNINKLVRNILSTMDEEERGNFVEALYAFLYGTEAKTLTGVTSNIGKIISSYGKLSGESKKALVSIGVKLWRDPTTRKLVAKNVGEALKSRKKQTE